MAMEQVLNQEYSQIYRHQGKKIVVMDVSFSSQELSLPSTYIAFLRREAKTYARYGFALPQVRPIVLLLPNLLQARLRTAIQL